MDALVGLGILIIPVLILVLIYRFLRRKPLWLKIPIGLCAPIIATIAAILVLKIVGFGSGAKCSEKEGFFLKLVCGISETYEDAAPYFRSLPSDEQMIAHFRKHRADFERLAHIYSQDWSAATRWGRVYYQNATPEAKEIMKRIGVTSIRSDLTIWMGPDPYSPKNRQRIRELMFEGRDSSKGQTFTGLVFRGVQQPVSRLNENLSEVFKGYYYTPFIPRVENDLLKKPDGGEWISPTLNSYPSKLISGNCVCCQFEPQWFIELCQGIP